MMSLSDMSVHYIHTKNSNDELFEIWKLIIIQNAQRIVLFRKYISRFGPLVKDIAWTHDDIRGRSLGLYHTQIIFKLCMSKLGHYYLR